MGNRKLFYACGLVVETWLFKSPFACSKSGLWPLRVWAYLRDGQQGQWYGIAFHGGRVADAHLRIRRARG